ncbi:MAG: hypothetical protein HC836_26205 [Richelia sp. RM2_1_2]|nr:hypothetical protein [Richelia sp. RM2_1_2]
MGITIGGGFYFGVDCDIGSVYEHVYKDANIFGEYRAIYDSDLKFKKRYKIPDSITFYQLVDWVRENLPGSWKITTDIGVLRGGKTVNITTEFSLWTSREEVLIQYALVWT